MERQYTPAGRLPALAGDTTDQSTSLIGILIGAGIGWFVTKQWWGVAAGAGVAYFATRKVAAAAPQLPGTAPVEQPALPVEERAPGAGVIPITRKKAPQTRISGIERAGTRLVVPDEVVQGEDPSTTPSSPSPSPNADKPRPLSAREQRRRDAMGDDDDDDLSGAKEEGDAP